MDEQTIMRQLDKAGEYVVANQDRLKKQFGKAYVAVAYRDVRGGIVVDSDTSFEKLMERTGNYGPLVSGTVDEIVRGNESVRIVSMDEVAA